MLTDGGPSCEITCALVMPTGNVGRVEGNGSTVEGIGTTVFGNGGTVIGVTGGIGPTAGRPMFSCGNTVCGNTVCGKNPTGGIAGPTLMITVFPPRKPNPFR